ncbi:hypothetical protein CAUPRSCDRAFT_11833, partial [Caulochytrium protostelioides]
MQTPSKISRRMIQRAAALLAASRPVLQGSRGEWRATGAVGTTGADPRGAAVHDIQRRRRPRRNVDARAVDEASLQRTCEPAREARQSGGAAAEMDVGIEERRERRRGINGGDGSADGRDQSDAVGVLRRCEQPLRYMEALGAKQHVLWRRRRCRCGRRRAGSRGGVADG